MVITTDLIYAELEQVMDPEIPALSVIDLGMISSVQLTTDDHALVKMTPTFVGCPAIAYIQNNIKKQLEGAIEGLEVEVQVDREISWNSDKITPEGRDKLKAFGLAPPKKACIELSIESLKDVKCPFCDSDDTQLKSAFGSTLCRAIHYCNHCKQAFEQFKPIP